MKHIPSLLMLVILCGAGDRAAAQRSEVPRSPEKQRIQKLLAPEEARWAKARRANPAVDGAIICPDLATVDLMTEQATDAATDKMVSVLTEGKSERIRRATPLPNLALFGCAFAPAGTPILVEEVNPAPFVQAEIGGKPFRGVTSPAMVEFDNSRGH